MAQLGTTTYDPWRNERDTAVTMLPTERRSVLRPELVAGGPRIPVRLLNELDSGRVVLFCGAGISAGPESGLPGFGDLVSYVYEANHLEPDEVEREALDLEEQNPQRRRPNYDKALSLLERPGRLKPQLMRRTVIERLSVAPKGELHVHKALVDLSRNEQGVRLVTTNFDNRFIEVGLDERLVDAAPKLPVPKPYAWSSVVHLHGRILQNDDGSNLVLTAADFGRAYLTERWAARFITEMFREFTVVFVGYSLGDPVMSYMVDALAAEAAKGARIAPAYAFASYKGSDVGKRIARDGWLAKNVDPILYDGENGHGLLAETLKEWARIRKDPFYARSRIAINEITKMPAGPRDPVAERVAWALQDPVAAKALADETPIVDEGDFVKLEKWLEVFDEKGLLCCAVYDTNTDASNQGGGVVRLVDDGSQSENPQNLDLTRVHLARWLARHLHVPQLLAWVLRNGGHLHLGLGEEIRKVLAAKDINIDPKLRLLWAVLLGNRPTFPWRRHLWTSDRYRAAASDAERRQVEDEAVESISPRLVVRAGPPSGLELRQLFETSPRAMRPIDTCAHIKLVSADYARRHQLAPILKKVDVLARHAETLTGYLEKALALGVDDDEVPRDSCLYRPSLTEHDPIRDDDDWTHLIDLARDSYFALASVTGSRAENLLRRWMESDQALFKRLALHALTENSKSDIQLVEELLLAGRKPGVWELELRREVLRCFRLAGARLPSGLLGRIVRGIHAGPESNNGKVVPNAAEIIRNEKALRLQMLRVSGARLDKRARALAEEMAASEVLEGSDEYPDPHGEGRIIGYDEIVPKELLQGSVDDVVAALESEQIGRDGFRWVAAKDPDKAASALRRLSRRGIWPSKYWQGFLWFLAGLRTPPERNAMLQEDIARILVEAPVQQFNGIAAAAAGFVKTIAEQFGTDREAELEVLWKRVWSQTGEIELEAVSLEDPLTAAMNHPAGELAEAALIRMWKYELRAGAGFPAAVRTYFTVIAEDPNGHFGRVMLATRLYHLFALDPEWTAEHLIARLSPKRSEEAADLWSAYGWSPRLGPDLFQAFKEPFLEFLRHSREGDRRLANLRGMFLTVCLETPGELTEQEIRGVVKTMSEEALKTVLGRLKGRLRGDPTERAAIWHDKVYPWLHAYWPREANRNTAGTSESILDLVVECGEAFPCAAKWSLDYLRPLAGRGLYRLRENGPAKHHGEWVLRILAEVVDPKVLPVHERDTLYQVLDVLAEANHDMAKDPRFQSLYQVATR